MGFKPLSSTVNAGNTNVDFVAPSGKQYIVQYGEVIVTANGTVANRTVRVGVYDDAGTPAEFYDVHSGLAVTAGQTIHHQLMPGTYRETAAIDNSVQLPMGAKLIVLPGWRLRVSLVNGVAGDNISCKFMVDEQ